MIRFIRIGMQVAIARILATGPGAALWEQVELFGLSEEAVVDAATLFLVGVLVALAEVAKRHPLTAKVERGWNLIISLGQSAADPTYEKRGRHEASA